MYEKEMSIINTFTSEEDYLIVILCVWLCSIGLNFFLNLFNTDLNLASRDHLQSQYFYEKMGWGAFDPQRRPIFSQKVS